MNELDQWRLQAYESSKLYKELAKSYHDRRIKQDKRFKEGNQVLLFNSNLKLLRGKLKSRWSRPFLVSRIHSNKAIKSLIRKEVLLW